MDLTVVEEVAVIGMSSCFIGRWMRNAGNTWLRRFELGCVITDSPFRKFDGVMDQCPTNKFDFKCYR